MKLTDKLKQNRSAKVAEIKAISEKATAENRSLSADEKQTIERIKAEVVDINSRIETEQFVEANEEQAAQRSYESKEEKDFRTQFSLVKAINEFSGRGVSGLSGLEAEMCREGQKELEEIGQRSYSNALVLPSRYFSRALTTSSNGKFGHTEQAPNLDIAQNDTIYKQLGVRVYEGLNGNFDCPNMASLTASFVSEDTTYSHLTVTNDKVTLTPRFLPASQSFSRNLLAQTTQTIQNDIINEFYTAIDRGVENEIMTQLFAMSAMGTGTTYSAGSKTLAWSDITAMEANATGAGNAYVMSRKLMGALKGRDKTTSSGRFIWENNLVNGYQAFASEFMNDKGIVFGNFKSLAVGFWGGLIFLNDPYSNKMKGDIDIQVSRLADVKVVNPLSFALIKNGI